MDTSSNDVSGKEILQHLKAIESRISQIENYLDLHPAPTEEEVEEEEVIKKKKSESDEELEFRIGQFWFAKLGIFAFLVGWIIANTLPFESMNQIIPVVIGIATGLVVIVTSIFFKNKLPHLSGWVLGSGFAILYIAALRMHYFSSAPVFSSIVPVLIIAYIISFILILSGINWKSPYITAFGFTTVYLSALLSDASALIFITIAFLALESLYLKIKHSWNGLFNFTIVVSYLVHLLWFINNPLIGNQLELKVGEPINLIFILVYLIIFTLAYYNDKKYDEYLPTAISILIITSMAYGLFLLITILSTPALGQVYHLAASIIFIGFAILFFTKKSSRMATFYYAMTGYAALSVAIILQFNKPDFFIWLCWQSVIVVSTAVWFRSKFIVVANFFIFLLIFLTFIILAEATSGISLSFGVVALLSARILNWKKDRLELKTEQMRNAYLITALLIIPYSLHNMMPSSFVAFSWIGVAILYYIFSLLLKNVKYRYMSLATFLLTVVYVFVLGITSQEVVFKILSFLVLGAALVIISVVYTRNRNKSSKAKETEG
ncbi:MAG: hypothetical protein OQK52_04680 [Ignavibacteriaceae bacterium]|jgi:hypothetical protein|nr:hypothetical protein [Ignavibacteriaceae bacterium]MCW8817157.1 hypothetical protein [Ignavibacteriaceae bacterium]